MLTTICNDPFVLVSTRIGKMSCSLNLHPLYCVLERPRVIDFVLCPAANLHRVPTHRSIAHQSMEPSTIPISNFPIATTPPLPRCTSPIPSSSGPATSADFTEHTATTWHYHFRFTAGYISIPKPTKSTIASAIPTSDISNEQPQHITNFHAHVLPGVPNTLRPEHLTIHRNTIARLAPYSVRLMPCVYV